MEGVRTHLTDFTELIASGKIAFPGMHRAENEAFRIPGEGD